MDKNQIMELKQMLNSISSEIYDDNLDIAKNIIISHLSQIDCKSLNNYIPSIQQSLDSEQLKQKVWSIASLCDLIVKTQYTLC